VKERLTYNTVPLDCWQRRIIVV